MTKARDSNGQVTPLCESLLASAILGSLVTPRMQREKKDKVGFFFVEEVDEQVDGGWGEKTEREWGGGRGMKKGLQRRGACTVEGRGRQAREGRAQGERKRKLVQAPPEVTS